MMFFLEEKQIFAVKGWRGEREGGGKNAFLFCIIWDLWKKDSISYCDGWTLADNDLNALINCTESPFRYLDLGLYMHFFVSALMPKKKCQTLHDQSVGWMVLSHSTLMTVGMCFR